MLKYFFGGFFCINLICYTLATEEEKSETNEASRREFVSENDLRMNRLLISSMTDALSEHDTIGTLAKMADNLLSLAAKNILKPNVITCATTTMYIGPIKMYNTMLPKGGCSICCHPKHPNHFVDLYIPQDSECASLRHLDYQNPGSLKNAGIDPELQTVFIIHGFTEGAPTLNIQNMCSAYKSRPEKYNIIVVDWREMATAPWYDQAAKNTKYVANIIANFIQFYVNTNELKLEKLYLIGFSLGAHVAGGIAKQFLYSKIPRITGLDPAFPLFPFAEKFNRLDKDDALFVDIIHTDAGRFGYPDSLGHIDFYANNGVSPQPGCWLISDRCSHVRATELYADSVRYPERFKIVDGNRYSYMGFKAIESNTAGDIYAATNDQSPYRVLL